MILLRRFVPLLMVVLSAGLHLFTAAGTATAQEDKVPLKDGKGRDFVVGNCNVCHSLDYIPMNSPFLDKKGWAAEVNKMINVMGASVDAKSVPVIVDYLSKNYGK